MQLKKRTFSYGKRIAAAAMVAAITLSSYQSAVASTLSNAKNAKDKAQQELESAQEKIDAIHEQQQGLQSEINSLDSDLVNLLVNIGILEGELSEKENELEQVSADLVTAEEKEKSQYSAMKMRIRYMYEKGDTAMVDAIIGSESMSDMLNRVEYVNGVYEYDRNLLTDYENTVQQVSDLKVTVETEKAELEDMQAEYDKQKDSLETMLASKKSELGNYDSQLASAQAAATKYQKTIEEQNAIIKEEEEKQKAAAKKAAEEAKAKAASSAATTTAKGDSTTTSSGSSPSYSTNTSGGAVVSYACQFVGNPYVWGGTSLTNGADCSGFVMSVYAHFGVSLPHSSAALQGCGKAVSYADAQPGDLICYSGHVAIYMGGGRIVHAQSAAVGITTSSATYRTIVAVRRVL